MSCQWESPFLRALASGATVSEAAAAARISSSAAYNRRTSNADFAEGWRLALEDSVDLLEREARRRAIDGVEEPVVYQGQLTPVWERDEAGEVAMREVATHNADGAPIIAMRPVQARNADGTLRYLTVRKPSDSLLALLLKGRRKDVFSDRHELTGADGKDLQPMDDISRASRIAQILAAASQRKDNPEPDFSDLA